MGDLLRRGPIEDVAAVFFYVSQTTVSRRGDLPRPVIGRALNDLRATPAQIVDRHGTALVDGPFCPAGDGKRVRGLFPAHAGYPGMNVHVSCDASGTIAAVGPTPAPGARHVAPAVAASGTAELLDGRHTNADLSDLAVPRIDLVPTTRPLGGELNARGTRLGRGLSGLRSAVERTVAHRKT